MEPKKLFAILLISFLFLPTRILAKDYIGDLNVLGDLTGDSATILDLRGDTLDYDVITGDTLYGYGGYLTGVTTSGASDSVAIKNDGAYQGKADTLDFTNNISATEIATGEYAIQADTIPNIFDTGILVTGGETINISFSVSQKSEIDVYVSGVAQEPPEYSLYDTNTIILNDVIADTVSWYVKKITSIGGGDVNSTDSAGDTTIDVYNSGSLVGEFSAVDFDTNLNVTANGDTAVVESTASGGGGGIWTLDANSPVSIDNAGTSYTYTIADTSFDMYKVFYSIIPKFKEVNEEWVGLRLNGHTADDYYYYRGDNLKKTYDNKLNLHMDWSRWIEPVTGEILIDDSSWKSDEFHIGPGLNHRLIRRAHYADRSFTEGSCRNLTWPLLDLSIVQSGSVDIKIIEFRVYGRNY